MTFKILGVGLGSLILFVLFRLLRSRYYSHWKPWIGLGWMLSYDEKTRLVTVATFLLKSPAGRADIKRGSILVARDGEDIPEFSKKRFTPWLKSKQPVLGQGVTYLLKEPSGNGEWRNKEVTLYYERLHGDIPLYAPLPTCEQRHQDWVRLMPSFKALYPMFRCKRTGVVYHRVRIVPVGDI